MENKLKTLFKGQDPSVRLFKEKMKNLSPEEVTHYYAHAYMLGLLHWQELSTAHQRFLKRLVQHDRQGFLDFLRQNLLGQLSYSFMDTILAARLLALIEKGEKQKASDRHFVFCFLLAFAPSLRIETVCRRIRGRLFMPEELQDINGKAIIDTGEQR